MKSIRTLLLLFVAGTTTHADIIWDYRVDDGRNAMWGELTTDGNIVDINQPSISFNVKSIDTISISGPDIRIPNIDWAAFGGPPPFTNHVFGVIGKAPPHEEFALSGSIHATSAFLVPWALFNLGPFDAELVLAPTPSVSDREVVLSMVSPNVTFSSPRDAPAVPEPSSLACFGAIACVLTGWMMRRGGQRRRHV